MKGHEVVSEPDQGLLLRIGDIPFARGRINNPKNGNLTLRSLDSFPHADSWAKGPAPEVSGAILRYELPEHGASSYITFVFEEIFGLRRGLVSHRFKLWWTRPVFIRQVDECPGRTMFMVWENENGSYGAILPLLCGVFRSELHGSRDGLRLIADSNAKSARGNACNLALVGRGAHPYSLIRQLCWAARQICPDMDSCVSKQILPEFSRYLGWSTAESLCGNINADAVLEGIRQYHKAGVPLGAILLDQGWQEINEFEQLTGLGINRERFPDGLRPCIETAKKEFGIRYFGAWLAIQGHWSGIDPNSELASRFGLFETERELSESGRGRRMKMFMFTPEAAGDFFDQYFSLLAAEGIDFIKCDNEGSLETFLSGAYGFDSVRSYQNALREASRKHMGSSVIHCMAMSADNLFNHDGTVILRNSDDCTPGLPHNAGEHLIHNSYNNLWTSHFAVPDWDAFRSNQKDGMLHAVSRALSGGPVYLSDEPGAHDPEVIHALVLSDGRILRVDHPAQPSPCCLFLDPRRESAFLKIFTCAAGSRIGLLGCFNVKLQPDEIQDEVRLEDLPDLNPEAAYAVYDRARGLCGVMRAGVALPFVFNQYDFALFTVAPIENGVAAFGLGDKLASGAALMEFGWISGKPRYRARVVEGGELVFYSESRPTWAHLDGEPVAFEYTARLIRISAPADGRPKLVELGFRSQKKTAGKS
jgi:raffinose synthase